MTLEFGVDFKEASKGFTRFFSSGHLESLRNHLIKGNVVNFEKLWVKNPKSPHEGFLSSISLSFVREDIARARGEPFSQKVVISGVINADRIIESGPIGDGGYFILGPCEIDKVFEITGTFEAPQIKDVTPELLGSNDM